MERLFVLKTLVTYSAGNEGKKICGVFSEDAPLLRSSGAAVVFHTFRWPFFFIAKALHMRIGIHSYGCRIADHVRFGPCRPYNYRASTDALIIY